MVDVENFADYMAAEIYFRNADWPHNNVRAWRAPNRPFKFIIFDLDCSFGCDWCGEGFDYEKHNMFDYIKQGGKSLCSGEHCFAEIYVKLIENANFRRLFINHSAVMLDYYLTYDKLTKAVDKMTATIPEAEMDRDLERFPRNDYAFDKTGAALKYFAVNRTEIVRDEYRKEFGLGKDISVTIAARGKGKILLDGMMLPEDSFTGKFFEGNEMLLTALPTKGGVFAGWDDGVMENPRLVLPEDGSEYTALFK